jgi:poly-D-alanine transfer protein DltD
MTKTPKSPEQLRVDSLIETIQQHPTDVLEAERRLYSTKWFDYRFMSSEELNRLFTKIYQQVYRRKFAAEVDMQFAKNVSGVHVLTMRKSQRERSQLVIARQRADEFGIPYPVYIEAAFKARR